MPFYTLRCIHQSDANPCVEQRCRDGYPLHHPKTHGREADEDGRRSDRS
ncbi:hypothetical protein O7C57_20420 (plasmid) [Providencia sp. 21OH12SH02B-Prov]|nr:hypothetical protein O7C57_20420 [Providencia sp. 21OH12SH02B-Prov]